MILYWIIGSDDMFIWDYGYGIAFGLDFKAPILDKGIQYLEVNEIIYRVGTL